MAHETDEHLVVLESMKAAGKLEPDVQSEGLPMVTETTIEEMLKLYRIRENGVPRYLPRYYDKDEYNSGSPFDTGMGIAEDMLRRFPAYDRSGYLYYLARWMNDSFKDTYESRKASSQDSATVGATFVLKAIEEQVGSQLVDTLKDVDDERVMKAFEATNPVKSALSLINRVTGYKPLPTHQQSLGRGLTLISAECPQPLAAVDGGNMQYYVLESLWDLLKK